MPSRHDRGCMVELSLIQASLPNFLSACLHSQPYGRSVGPQSNLDLRVEEETTNEHTCCVTQCGHTHTLSWYGSFLRVVALSYLEGEWTAFFFLLYHALLLHAVTCHRRSRTFHSLWSLFCSPIFQVPREVGRIEKRDACIALPPMQPPDWKE